MYQTEVKQRIIELAQQGRPVAQLAREYEPSEATIHKWLRESRRDSAGLRSERAESERNRQLEREVKQLREINEILGKATAWFARDHQPGV